MAGLNNDVIADLDACAPSVIDDEATSSPIHRCSDFSDISPGYAKFGVNGLIFHDANDCSSGSPSNETDITVLTNEEQEVSDEPVNEGAREK